MVKKPKLLSGIRTKLFSAVAMLLVAVIMVVSSTYAWFTLSTAPEVTGISTSIGANGALEMALRYSAGDAGTYTPGAVRDGVVISDLDSNTYWGNLVDMSNDQYGLSNIILYPSLLNTEGQESGTFSKSSILCTPVYGADGRVSELAANTMIGSYVNADGMTGFYENDILGVRGIGTSSGLSDRQLAYRNASALAAAAMVQAKTFASTSLTAHGNALSSLAVSLAMDPDYACSADDVAKIELVVIELNKSVAQLDKAYQNAVYAYAASGAIDDANLWQTIKAAVEAENATAASVIAVYGEAALPEAIAAGYTHYMTMRSAIADANGKLDEAKTDPTSAKVKAALTCIINPANLLINSMTVTEAKADISNLANAILSAGGVKIEIAEGGGFYADVAKQCGNFQASVTIDKLEYGGTALTNVKATMKTKASEPYSVAVASELVTAGAPTVDASSEAKPMTEFYGYVIDLAFRTNASASNLLLQTDPTDRIYDGNGNEQTQGSGSVMKFNALTRELSADQIKNLMENIRIVFFLTDATDSGYTILQTARLDTTAGTFTATSGEARVKLDGDSNVITALTQNVQTNISVLVYLDGSTIENSDVAATAAMSLSGSLNLQFASDANLVPMENGDLHMQGGSASGSETTTEATTEATTTSPDVQG